MPPDAPAPRSDLRLILHEDDDLLLVHKPPGWNTHAPSPYTNEGLYEWLRHREPRWASLAIIHRLDKETSGVMVFAKTARASRSLTQQFESRLVAKTYWLLAHPRSEFADLTVKTGLVRTGDRYRATRAGEDSPEAITHFRTLQQLENGVLVEARPATGRTHQIRVHAAERGFPILGDVLYGGRSHSRVCLHAREISFRHPATGDTVRFEAPVDFETPAAECLRNLMFADANTTAFRMVHGASDGWPGIQVDRLGDWLLVQSESPLAATDIARLDAWRQRLGLRGLCHKTLTRRVQAQSSRDLCPRLLCGEAPDGPFLVRENGLQFELSFEEGYSHGLFLDQRDNRRRFARNHVAAGFDHLRAPKQSEVLNLFAYTCGFSVSAATTGARTTSIDLSKKYLDWGRRNFATNRLDASSHEFLAGDVFDWLGRFQRKGRRFDAIVLDPPTFSRSKQSGAFRAEADYSKLIAHAVAVLKSDGVLLACNNAAKVTPVDFIAATQAAVVQAGRHVKQQHYIPQPPDFPITRAEPAHLKTLWQRLD